MNAENKIKALNDELRSVKASYQQSSRNLTIYEYKLDVSNYPNLLEITMVFNTSDGSNAMVSISGATYYRLSYNGGAKFYLRRKLENSAEITLYSTQKGEISTNV